MKLVNVIILIIMLSVPVNSYGGDTNISIIYTGSLEGELEPCGCSPKTDFGGVARLSGYLEQRKAGLDPLILIDAGNFTQDNTEQGRLKVEAMLRSFSVMKYDVVALQENEKAFEEDFLKPLFSELKIPDVSGSTAGSYIEMLRGDVKILASAHADDCREGMLNILLTDRKLSEARPLVGWDIIILSSGEILDAPVRTENTIIISGYPKGKNVGILTLRVDASGKVKDMSHRWQPLGSDIMENTLVRNVLNEYDTGVAALMKERKMPPSGMTYSGVSKCAECHQLFIESWEETSHATAFLSLKDVGKSADPECVVCHSVGYGEEGGFYSMESTPHLANVQCESCHGFDLEHISDYSKPMKKVEKSVCLKCHTEDRSPDFRYTAYREKIRHWE